MLRYKDLTLSGVIVLDKETNVIKIANSPEGVLVLEGANFTKRYGIIVRDNVGTATIPCTLDMLFAGPRAKAHIVTLSGKGSQRTNSVSVKIWADIPAKPSKEEDNIIIEIKQKLYDLQRNLDLYAKGVVNYPAPTKGGEKGWVYTVIDDKGNTAFVELFADTVNKINGVLPFNREIKLTGEDIQVSSANEKSIDSSLADLQNKIGELSSMITNLIPVVTELTKTVTKLEVLVEDYINTDI